MAKNIAELALKAQNVEELIALAKEAGIELALEEAKKFFSQACIDDQDLENVSGGLIRSVPDQTASVDEPSACAW